MPINSAPRPAAERVDAVVIGAGLSGLTAARELHRHGLDIVVAEARDRIGGRVWTDRSAGVVAELGAQWVGRDHHRVRRLAAELGIELVDERLSGTSVVDLGHGNAGGIAARLASAAAVADGAQLGARLWWLARRIRRDGPTAIRGADRLDTTTLADWIDARAWTEGGAVGLRHLAEGGTCASATEVSTLEIGAQLASMGGARALAHADASSVIGGVDQLASGLATELGDRIRTSCAVEAISAAKDGVRVRTAHGELLGRDIVVAVPPPTVGAIDIDPALGELAAHGSIELARARVVKQVLVYDSPWWRDRGLSGQADTPTRAIDFLTDASGRARRGVLVALATGPRADALLAVGADERRALTLTHVERVLGPAPAGPTCVLHHDWVADPWTLGGYASRRGPGGWTSSAPTSPGHPRVHLAGTEQAVEWRSYMEGALDAGERAARAVMIRRSTGR